MNLSFVPGVSCYEVEIKHGIIASAFKMYLKTEDLDLQTIPRWSTNYWSLKMYNTDNGKKTPFSILKKRSR